MKKRLFAIILFLCCMLNTFNMPVMAAEEEATAIPSSYDGRDYGYITKLRSQYGGTCWAFGTIAAAEISIVKSGLSDNTLDLSEYHTVHYTYADKFNDPLGNTLDDVCHSDGSYPRYLITSGGQIWFAYETLARWSGPVYEKDLPYSNDEYLVGIYPEVTEDMSTNAEFHLKNVICAKGEGEELKEDTKRLIMKYGAVAMSYYVGPAAYYNNYDYEEITYHIPNAKTPNHVAAIIGWDDNYPKENFNYQPENDGAWLIKNTTSKYMWISYETFLRERIALEFESADRLENNYQYDGHSCGSSDISGETFMNVYEAKRSSNTLEELKAVMLNTWDDTTYEICVYVNPVIKDGKMVDYESVSDTFTYYAERGGKATIDLPESIYLNEHDTFGIEVTNDKDGYTISTTGEYGFETVHAGESYVGTTTNDELVYTDMADVVYKGNLRIKGFTNSTDIPLAEDVTIETRRKTLKEGESFTLKADVDVPKGAMDGITYLSLNPSVAEVDENGNVTAVSPGEAVISVRATYGRGMEECTVIVEEKPQKQPTLATSITLNKNSMTLYPYYEEQLIAVVDEAADNKNVTYESSNEAVATVDKNGLVRGRFIGTAVITARTTDGSNLSATCTVTIPSFSPSEPATPPGNIEKPEQETITLGLTSNTIKVGETAQLIINRLPVGTNGALAYAVSDNSIVSLNGNTITGLKAGTAVITVTSVETGVYVSINITVTPSAQTVMPANKLTVGSTYTYAGLQYKVLSDNGFMLIGTTNKNIKKLVIPSAINTKYGTYKVTEIAKNAFLGYKNLKTVQISKNIEKIGTKAFYKCKKLKTVTIESKVITSVGKNAFKGIPSNAKITVPKKKYNSYKKTVFAKAGIGSKVTWKKK